MHSKRKLAIISTHPIQYNAPLFQLLAQRSIIDIRVFYTWGKSVLETKYDPGFGKVITWDIPLLKDYAHQFEENIADDPGSHHFRGIDNPNLIKNIESWGADAILVYGWSYRSHLKAMRHFHGKIPVLFRGDSTLLDAAGGGSKALARKLFLRWVYRHIDHALFVGKANRTYFEAMGLQSQQLHFAPHAIDNQRFGVSVDRTFRRSLGFAENEVVYLFAGKLETKKNPALLIRAFAALQQPNTRLWLVGNGPLESELNDLILSLPLQTQALIHHTPFVNQLDMPAVYQSADVFVLPSKGPGETWGLAVNEAMSSGLPVIVSDRCGCASDLVEPGVNGWMFNSDDKDSLMESMKKLTDWQVIKEMGKKSREHIAPWNFTQIAEVIENLVVHS